MFSFVKIVVYNCESLHLKLRLHKIVAFSRVRQHRFFSSSCVCLHQNVCLYLCAPPCNCLLVLVHFDLFLCYCSNVLLCALFDFVVLYKLEALTAIASRETTHVRPMKFKTIILTLLQHWAIVLKLNDCRAKLRWDLDVEVFVGNLKWAFLLSNLAFLGNKDCSSTDFEIYKLRPIAQGCNGGLRKS